MLRIGLFAFAAFACACATAEERTQDTGRDCFRTSTVRDFNVIDRNTVEVRVSPGRRYVLTTNFPTNHLHFAEMMAIRSSTGSVCTGDGPGVELVGGDPVQAYPVQTIARAHDPAPGS